MKRHYWLGGPLLIAGVIVATLYFAGASRDEVHDWLERWSVAEWAVALGTFSLAAYTYLLARRAQGQIEHQRRVSEEATRPIVYPIATDEWMRSEQNKQYLLIRNGGLGPALQVEGIVEWNAPGARPAPQHAVWQSGGLGPGEARLNRLARPKVEDWHNARGFLVCMGVDRRRWQTDFATQVEEGGIIVMRVSGIRELEPNDIPALS